MRIPSHLTRISIIAVLAMVMFGASCTKTTTTNTNATNTSTVTNTPPTNSRTTGSFSTSPTDESSLQRVTILASGLDRPNVTIALGERVEFRNADVVRHHLASNPHPTHTDLPGFEQDISAGGNFIFTFTRQGTFGYHDHNTPSATAFQGTITVQ